MTKRIRVKYLKLTTFREKFCLKLVKLCTFLFSFFILRSKSDKTICLISGSHKRSWRAAAKKIMRWFMLYNRVERLLASRTESAFPSAILYSTEAYLLFEYRTTVQVAPSNAQSPLPYGLDCRLPIYSSSELTIRWVFLPADVAPELRVWYCFCELKPSSLNISSEALLIYALPSRPIIHKQRAPFTRGVLITWLPLTRRNMNRAGLRASSYSWRHGAGHSVSSAKCVSVKKIAGFNMFYTKELQAENRSTRQELNSDQRIQSDKVKGLPSKKKCCWNS